MNAYPLLTAALLVASVAAAAPKSGVGDLGDSLLDADLVRALTPIEAEAATAPRGADWLPDEEMLRRLLQDGADQAAGEDVGGSPLASVVNGMRRAESLIRDQADDKVAVPVQREVVAQLDRLIAQMEKQCQGGSCNKPKPDSQKQASKRTQSKPGQCDKEGECDKPGQPGQKLAKKANQSGATSFGGAPNAAEAEAPEDLMKAAWGHLPERVREQMLQGAGGEFLPEYREALQQYYRRLAERSAEEAP